MSDFGLDAFALDDLGSPGTSHPLQVARDLIATGKPRSALDILAEHHARLADDPDYLMLCGQAWFAAGDAPRAQHALLGAARVAPTDPRPLQLLGELLLERGEIDRAKRLFRRAERLGESEPAEPEALEVPEGRGDADLIASAERKEKRRRNPAAVRQWLLMLVTVLAIGGLMSAIASWVAPDDPSFERAGATDGTAANSTKPVAATASTTASDESMALERATSEPVVLDPAATAAAPESPETDAPEPPAETTPPPAEHRESTVPVPAEKPTVPAPPPEPAAASIEGTAWPEDDASPLLAPPAPIAESLVPTVAAIATSTTSPVVRARPKKTRPMARKVTKSSRPPAAPPVVDEAAVEAELASMSDARTATDRGDQLAAEGELAAAARFYRRAVDLDPDYAPALVSVGRSYLRAEKYTDAMRSATRALQHARGVDARPGLEAEALYQMGRVRHEWGDQDAARRLLRQSTSMVRAPAEAWFYLGESLARDNWPDARAAYEEYLARRPNGHLSDRARRAIQ